MAKVLLFILLLVFLSNSVVPDYIMSVNGIELGEIDENEKEAAEETEELKKKEINHTNFEFELAELSRELSIVDFSNRVKNAQDVYYTIESPPPDMI